MNQENQRSRQYIAGWVGVSQQMTSHMDNVRGHRLLTPTIDTKTVSLQTSDIQRSILIKTIQKKSHMDQSHVVMTKDKVQQAPNCTNTFISCTLSSSNAMSGL